MIATYVYVDVCWINARLYLTEDHRRYYFLIIEYLIDQKSKRN